MAEPASTTAGVSLTVLFVALLGPLAGPYMLIFACALAGSMWPLFEDETPSHAAGGWLVLRCTLTSIVLTGFIAWLLEQQLGWPVNESIGSVALFIAALGNGWRGIFSALGTTVKTLAGHLGGGGKS